MNKDLYQLNPAEWELINDRDILPRKHQITAKMESLLLNLGDFLFHLHQEESHMSSLPPKLSKGENYHQQAYRVMDFPRMVDGKSFLFYRAVILWGHPIGLHLIGSGHFQRSLTHDLLQSVSSLSPNWQLATQETPWTWEAEAEGWKSLCKFEQETLQAELEGRSFFKISYFLPLVQYLDLLEKGQDLYKELRQVFSILR